MATPRLYRNIEFSISDYITAQLTADAWTNVTVSKTLANAYSSWKDTNAVILITLLTSRNPKKEMGNTAVEEYPYIMFRIFGIDEGNRLDLAKWLLDKIVAGIPYKTYAVTAGTVESRSATKTGTLAGRISVYRIAENRKDDLGTDVEKPDKYRHVISCEVHVGITS